MSSTNKKHRVSFRDDDRLRTIYMVDCIPNIVGPENLWKLYFGKAELNKLHQQDMAKAQQIFVLTADNHLTVRGAGGQEVEIADYMRVERAKSFVQAVLKEARGSGKSDPEALRKICTELSKEDCLKAHYTAIGKTVPQTAGSANNKPTGGAIVHLEATLGPSARPSSSGHKKEKPRNDIPLGKVEQAKHNDVPTNGKVSRINSAAAERERQRRERNRQKNLAKNGANGKRESKSGFFGSNFFGSSVFSLGRSKSTGSTGPFSDSSGQEQDIPPM